MTYEGRLFVLRGLDPMSVPERRADLVDPATGERVQAPLSDVVPALRRPSPEGFGKEPLGLH